MATIPGSGKLSPAGIGLIALALLFAIAAPSDAAPVEGRVQAGDGGQVACGGPYVVGRARVERFSGKFQLTDEQAASPLRLTIFNGLPGKDGLNWMRVFLCGDINVKGLDRYEDPQGDLLLDRNYTQKPVTSIAITGQAQAGVNTIVIEGTGPKGASVSWVVDTAEAPRLSDLNPRSAAAGGRLTLAGQGFSLDDDENVVTVGGVKVDVLHSSASRLTLRLPAHLPPGPASVVVSTNGRTSAPFPITVTAAP